MAIAVLYFLGQNRGWGAIADIASATGVAAIGIVLILVGERRAEVFVRDRGVGFDIDMIAGVRSEIRDTVDIVAEAEDVESAVLAIAEHKPEMKFLALSVSDAVDDVIGIIRAGARGDAYKEVAKELFISVKTVETHVSSVLRKLQLSSRHELTRWANDRRLI